VPPWLRPCSDVRRVSVGRSSCWGSASTVALQRIRRVAWQLDTRLGCANQSLLGMPSGCRLARKGRNLAGMSLSLCCRLCQVRHRRCQLCRSPAELARPGTCRCFRWRFVDQQPRIQVVASYSALSVHSRQPVGARNTTLLNVVEASTHDALRNMAGDYSAARQCALDWQTELKNGNVTWERR
jgi:hypothetical protein